MGNQQHACRFFVALNYVPRDPEETAIRQVVGLGYSPEDVRHMVLTRLHLDHNGGLPDLPWAKVHAFATEYANGSRCRPGVGRSA